MPISFEKGNNRKDMSPFTRWEREWRAVTQEMEAENVWVVQDAEQKNRKLSSQKDYFLIQRQPNPNTQFHKVL